MKVLFISSSIETKFNPFLNAFKKLDIFLEICYYPNFNLSIYDRIKFKFLIHSSIKKYNQLIIKQLENKKYDLVIVVKGMYIYKSTTLLIRKCTNNLVFWSNDDIIFKHNNSIFLKNSLRYYDLIYTMKILNIYNFELRKFKVNNVEYLLQCYADDLSNLATIERNEFLYEVIFIGTYENQRFETIKYLCDNNIKVDVFGNGWDNINYDNTNFKLHKPVTELDYLKSINKSKISLCFLRKANRDNITVRSVEIPAYGGFLIGEYSVEHQFLFENKVEAIWCKNNKEFLDNINYYLKNEIEREQVMKNGFSRVRKLHCSYELQARYIKESFSITNRN